MWWGSAFYPYIPAGDNRFYKKLNKYENDLEWRNTFSLLLNMAAFAFEWDGLPDSCNERFLEMALLTRGKACLALDGDMWLSLMCGSASELNIYGDPSEVAGYGFNGYNKVFKAFMEGADNNNAKAFVCRDNEYMYPYIAYIIRETDRMTSAARSIDIAAKKLKNPYFINCSESQVTSVRQVLSKVDENEEVVISSKALTPDAFQILPTKMDKDTLSELWNHFNNLDNRVRSILGIVNNNQMDKKERLIVDEVNSNNQYTDIQIEMRLQQRKKFCKQINDAMGLNISVKLRDAWQEQNNAIEGEVFNNDDGSNSSEVADSGASNSEA